MISIKKINLLLALAISILLFSCSKENETPENDLTISKEIKDLIYFSGDEKASTVIVNTQGGPITELATTEFNDILKNVNTTNVLTVNVHQKQTLKPNLFTDNNITFSQAIDYDAESIEMLYNVIKYFKDQGRIVYVLGISFGAFMTQELIQKKGIDVADKYLIMVGRLDIDEVFWKWFSEGNGGYFKDGVKPVFSEITDIVQKNMTRLASGLGRNRYTKLLNRFPSLSKITYVYGKTDSQVGRLTEAEVQFLQSKGANIIVGEEGHGETTDDYIVQGFKEAFGIE